MKFREVFRFELSYQIRQIWPWLIIGMLMALVFLFVRDGSFSEALYTEFFINSPFMVAMATVFGNLLWLLTSAFVAGEAAARDVSARMHPLSYTLPISRASYLGGRFLVALAINAFILLTVQLTIILAIYLPGVHPDSIGPFRPLAFINAYFFIALPNAFAATAIQFTLAIRSGRPIIAYIGSLILFFTSFFIASLIFFRSGLGTLLDPIGVRFVWDELSHLWTNVEKSWRLLELKGTLLQNRLVWTTVGLASMVYAYLQFQFSHRVPGAARSFLKFRRHRRTTIESTTSPSRLSVDSNIGNLRYECKRSYGLTLEFRQMVEIAWTSFRALATSGTGIGLLILIPLVTIVVVIDQMSSLGLPLTPTTASVLRELTGPLSADMSRWMVVPGFIIYFTGELIWRERDYGLGEITDAIPGSEWAPITGKLFGLWLMLFLFTTMLTVAGVLSQIILGYHNFEIGLYLKVMLGLQLPEYLLFAALTVFIHVVIDQKYLGHLFAIIAYAFIAAIATMLGIEHNMLIFGAGPTWSYTEMRGFGPFLGPWLWFKLYWASWALVLLVIAMLFRVRGKELGLRTRIQISKHRFTKPTAFVASVAALLIISIGGFIFYNTNILNKYVNGSNAAAFQAEYERRYGRYENNLQPEITDVKLHVEIYPAERTVEIQGTYELINTSNAAVDTIHVSTSMNGAVTKSIVFDRNATLKVNDEQLHYKIYALERPLKPRDTIHLEFTVSVEPKGFRNRGIDPSLTESGSYFTNESWFPFIAYQRQRALINPAQRREHGLEARPVIASLYEAHDGEAVSLGKGIAFDAVIGTSDDQVAVAPGALCRRWSENGRQYFHYASSAPIGNEWGFFSANYEVYEREWTPAHASNVVVNASQSVADESLNRKVVVRIFHHPSHVAHLEPMMKAVLSSLDYYSEQFGGYPYNHLSVVEHPAAPGTGLHADPSLIYYGQASAHWIRKDANSLDFPYAVMGHEMGHQWTLPYAYVEGLPFLSEGIAWYYGIMLVKATRDPEQTRRLMSFMRQPYPYQPIRRGEPLLRAVDPYLAYKRGPLAMFALTEYAGVEPVNTAIRSLVAKSNAPGATAVTTLDLYHALKAVAPDSAQTLLHDLFEVNTLWMFEASKVSAVKTGSEEWEVTLDVKAKKIMYDSAGTETALRLDEWVPIGVFAKNEPGHDELSVPLYLEKHLIHSGQQTIKVKVKGKPVLAGIDPHHVLDWEEKEDDDNIEEVVRGK